MKFGKLFRYDLRSGFSGSLFRLLMPALAALVSCAEFRLRLYMEYPKIRGTFLDYLIYLSGGMKKYIPIMALTEPESFIFPARWMVLHLLILYGALYYPVRDLANMGTSALPRSGSRGAWWLSKCLWNLCYVVTAYAMAVGVVLLFCLAAGAEMNLSMTSELVNTVLDANSPDIGFPVELGYAALFFPLLFAVTAGQIQMTLSLFVKPVVSFGIMTGFLLCGAYLDVPVFWSSWSMAVRSIWVIYDGWYPGTAGAVMTGCAAAAMTIGFIRFRRYSIMGGEE